MGSEVGREIVQVGSESPRKDENKAGDLLSSLGRSGGQGAYKSKMLI